MGKVRHAVAPEARHAHRQLDQAVEEDEIFRLDGYRDEHQVEWDVGEHHPEGQQDAEDRARGSDGYEEVVKLGLVQDLPAADIDHLLRGREDIAQVYHPRQFLDDTRPDAGYDVVNQEPLRPPDALQHAAEHIDGEHIKEDVRKVGVHEHIRY